MQFRIEICSTSYSSIEIDFSLWYFPHAVLWEQPRFAVIMPQETGNTRSYLLKIDDRLCKGCRLCIDFCPKGVLDMSVKLNEGGTPYAEVRHSENCIGCKSCTLVCPEACVELFEQEDS